MPNNSQKSKWLNKLISSKYKTQSNDDLENASIAHKSCYASSNGLYCNKRIAELETKVEDLVKQVKDREICYEGWIRSLANSDADVKGKLDNMSKNVATISDRIAMMSTKIVTLSNQVATVADEIATMSDNKMTEDVFLDEYHEYYDQQTNIQSRAGLNWI